MPSERNRETEAPSPAAAKEIKIRLKDCLARIFRPPLLHWSSAAVTASSRSLSAGASSRSLTADIAHEPVFIPRRRATGAEDLHVSFLRRSFSLDRRSRKPIVSTGCGGCHPSSVSSKKKERTLREKGGFFENTGEGARTSPSLPSPKSAHPLYYCFGEEEMKASTWKKKKKKKQRCRLSVSSSSMEDEAFGFFRSEETETFFSSRSFSSDSSEFYRRPLPKAHKKKKKEKEEKPKSSIRPQRSRRRTDMSEKEKNPPKQRKTKGFQPLVSVSLFEEEEERREEGFAVVRRSSDPYGDFRKSMVEMIVERQIFGAEELERLLHCYLSLNSVENHSAILRAFADISEVLFSY